MRTASWLSWSGWDRFLVGACAWFHAGTAAALAAFPTDQLLNPGTKPVLDMASQYVWAVVFGVTAILCWELLRTDHPVQQMVTWAAVMVPGGLWATSMGLAVSRGEGSPILLVFALTVYGMWAVVAVRIGLGKR